MAPSIPFRAGRRQALKVVAAAATLPLGALALQQFASRPGYTSWEGESLGGPSSLTLWGDTGAAEDVIFRLRSEIERLEGVFSLFRADSEIARLNQHGHLLAPSPDMVAVLSAARGIAAVSSGAFDPSVQPLWRLYENHFRLHPDATEGPDAGEVAAARQLVDYRRIEIEPKRIGFATPGMAVTLNGIAQGYITDRIADLLGNEGFANAMVEVGETRAIGGQPEGGPWSVAIKDPRDPLSLDRSVTLANQALSVSGGYGTPFGRSAAHHIFDPATGYSAAKLLDVAVVAPRAMDADGLSTAIYVAGEAAAPKLLAAYPGAHASMTRPDGTIVAT